MFNSGNLIIEKVNENVENNLCPKLWVKIEGDIYRGNEKFMINVAEDYFDEPEMIDIGTKFQEITNGSDLNSNNNRDILDEDSETNDAYCPLCKIKFPSMRHLRNHVRTNDKRFACCQCERVCRSFYKLRMHHRIHTGERPYKCGKCQLTFCLKTTLLKHFQTHEGCLECPICKFKCANLIEYESHLATHSSPDNPQYECDECNKKFHTSTYLARHKKRHKGERPHICLICNRRFTVIGSLKSHMAIHRGEKKFKCDICTKTFILKSYLREHRKRHEEVAPFKCDECTKYFTTEPSLKRHKLVVH